MSLGKILALALLLAPAAPLRASRTTDAVVHVRVVVDYGPAGKPTLDKAVILPPGSSVVDATRAVADVKQGVVCCDPRDVEAIGGVKCDAQNKAWWIYELNGQKGPVSAFRCLVLEGDRVTWRYQTVKDAKLSKTLSCATAASK